MRIPRPSPLAGALAVLLAAALAPTPASAHPTGTGCSTDPAAHLASVPSPEAFLGFPLGAGQQRVVTNSEIRDYLSAVDKASDRVTSGTMGTSVLGQPLRYAVVTGQKQAKRSTLDAIADQIRGLRDPRSLNAAKARRIAAETPAIAWIAGNVHGGETSGADASLKTLYELAAGLSCPVQK